MLRLPASIRIFLCAQAADMRRGFDGLALMTQSIVGEDPLSGHFFVFRNRRGDRLKILYFDRDGYALWYKRLEAGTFRFPPAQGGRIEIDHATLTMILEGIDATKITRRRRFALTSAGRA
jgi:transposase